MQIQSAGQARGLLRQVVVACLPLALGCSAQTAPDKSTALLVPEPMRVKGLESLGVAGSLNAQVTALKVTGDVLSIKAAGRPEPVVVTAFREPWAAQVRVIFNENRAGGGSGHSVQVFRSMQPFGLAQGIFITRSNGSLPWLGIQTNASSGQKVLADWLVLYTRGSWILQRSGQAAGSSPAASGTVNLQLRLPTALSMKGNTWCLHSTEKAQRQGETPLLDWIVVQQPEGVSDCN